jgi:hypothetical protein
VDLKQIFVPISKVDAEKRLVYGVMVSEAPDSSGEIFDYARSKPHFSAWSEGFSRLTDGKSKGNLRVMHGNKVAGHAVSVDFDDAAKQVLVCDKITDNDEWAKVLEGDYTGFSIGGRYLARWKDGDLTRYEARPIEHSLVDAPCVPDATFKLVKADGTEESHAFKHNDEHDERGRFGTKQGESAHSDREHAAAAQAHRAAADSHYSQAHGPKEDAHRDAGLKHSEAARLHADMVSGQGQHVGEGRYGQTHSAGGTARSASVRANAASDRAGHAKSARIEFTPGLVKAEIEAGRAESLCKLLNENSVPREQEAPVVEKCWQISAAIQARESIESLINTEAGELATGEDTDPSQVTALQEALAALDRFIVSETQEQLGDSGESAGEEITQMDTTGIRKMLDDKLEAETSALKKAIDDGLSKWYEKLNGNIASATDGLAKTEAVKAVADTVAALETRLQKVEETPAAVGRPAAVVEKVLPGGTESAADAPSLDALTKAVDAIAPKLREMGLTGDERNLRLALAQASMLGAK